MAAIFLARVKTCHGGPHPFREKAQVEIAQWSRPGTGQDRRAFEQILEIAIVVAVQPSNATAFPVANHLATNIAVLAAVVSFDGEPAVRPELSLGAKTWVFAAATSKAARIGPMEGIWRNNFTAGCLWLSITNSQRAA